MNAFLDKVMPWYWPVWLFILFGVPEAVAMITRHYQNTLSEWTWRVFDVMPGQTIWQYRFAHILLIMFVTWLWFHLCFALFR